MAMDYVGLVTAFNLGQEAYVPLDAFVREVFIPEAPLLTRLPRAAAANENFEIVTYDVRPNALSLGVAIASNSTTSITIVNAAATVDATPLLPGDILEWKDTNTGVAERVMVSQVQSTADGLWYATQVGAPTVITVVRGQEGTTAATAVAQYAAVTLVGNSRTGGEINQGGTRATRTQIHQQIQTYQYPITLGGKAAYVQSVSLPVGISDIFTLEQKTKMTEMVRDVEKGFYYGMGQRVNGTTITRATQTGLRSLINQYGGGTTTLGTLGTNVTLTAGASYTRNSLFTATIAKCLAGGGDPDLMLVSTDFVTFIDVWAGGSQFFMDPEYTELGVAIGSFTSAFIGRPIRIQPCYQLRPGTCVAVTSKDLKIRHLRQEMMIRRAVLGDATMADVLCDMAIELGHPGWHAWVEGITSAA